MIGQQNYVNNKFKTSLCRHYLSNGNCQLGLKCAFAHGEAELRNQNDPIPAGAAMINPNQIKMQGGYASNFKTIKCKYHEQGSFCKNGPGCTFAHGDVDLRPPGFGGAGMQFPGQYDQFQMQQQQQYGGFQQQMPYGQFGQPQQFQQGFQQQPQFNQQNQKSEADVRSQAMLYIVKYLEQVLKDDQSALSKLKQAADAISQNDTQGASSLVQEIMNDPNRTPQELQAYQQIFQQAQAQLR